MSDEWISYLDGLPGINKRVKIITHENIIYYGKSILLCERDFVIETDDGYFIGICLIKSWGYIKGKYPDFGKLKEGDFIIIEWVNNGIKFKEVGLFEKIETGKNNIIILRSGNNDNHFFESDQLENIKKITRINIEEKTFEEI